MSTHQSRKQRFAEILRLYRARHQLSQQQLANVLQKPRSTVRRWLAGQRLPRAVDQMLLCGRLNINFDALYSDDQTSDLFFDQQLIGIAALQHRYLDLQLRDPFAALSLVPLGGCLTLLFLMKAGLEASSTSGPDFTTEIVLSTADLKAYVVSVQGRGMEGIGFWLRDNSGVLTPQWRPLSHSSLKSLAAFLNDKSHRGTSSEVNR